ncbi:unnamed protein product [Penicillium olsonii]|nr:unnamed protein product [Penicillium olsonii]CAG7933416.1 unnamed protein product [Penicillium olsonii]
MNYASTSHPSIYVYVVNLRVGFYAHFTRIGNVEISPNATVTATAAASPFTITALYAHTHNLHKASHSKMPSVKLHPRSSVPGNQATATAPSTPAHNPLPTLLQTPSGLALLELQGTINVPSGSEDEDLGDISANIDPASIFETPIGKLMFPDYSTLNPEDTKWMKRAYLYVGRYQRMTGEVKKLPHPIAVLQKRPSEGEELEVVDIVRYKIFFKNRPEPVNNV